MKIKILLAALFVALLSPTETQAQGDGNPYIGEIIMFAGDFAPYGWASCDGQLLSISENNALFSILGTMYGGDGITTFGLPDLRGRAAIGKSKDGRNGDTTPQGSSGSDTAGGLSVRYIIAIKGVYPPRS